MGDNVAVWQTSTKTVDHQKLHTVCGSRVVDASSSLQRVAALSDALQNSLSAGKASFVPHTALVASSR